MKRLFLFMLCAAIALGGCARPDREASVPPARTGAWLLEARLETRSPDFPLLGNREVEVVYSVTNRGRAAERLQFPTDQRIELSLRSPDGATLFLWSEDRLFADTPSVVLINPGERLEYRATVPTRDMVAGHQYTAEAGLVGHEGTAASLVLHPR
jgi:hypothetical protein